MSGPAELVMAALLGGLLLALNAINILHRGFNSDEMGHLHIIWSWTRGFVQYRDVFDNHMPLFHLLFAPLLALIGDRATILYWMRLILLPMYFVAAWCTYAIATRLFSRRAGAWSVLALGFYTSYHLVAFEFRTDNLWTPLWLLCVTSLVTRTITVRRSLVAGVLLGFCFAVSMKSTIFLLSLAISFPLAIALVRTSDAGRERIYFARCAATFFAGSTLVPGTIAIFFAVKGVWRDFRYGVLDFNFLADEIYKNQLLYNRHPVLALVMLVSTLTAAIYIGRWIVSACGDRDVAFRRTFVFFICVFYIALFKILWPPISRSYSGFYPLASALLVGGIFAASRRLDAYGWKFKPILRPASLLASIVLAEMVFLLWLHPIRKNGTQEETRLLRNVLALTEPTDYVFDCKGETVFRPRCFRPILEAITIRAIHKGILVDDAPQRCIGTQTCVVATILGKRFSSSTRQFVLHNYLPVTKDLRVAGMVLHASPQDPHRLNFQVVIPADYQIMKADRTVSGMLDGSPYRGARFLSAGLHSFESESVSDDLILLWAKAIDRHFPPLATRSSPRG